MLYLPRRSNCAATRRRSPNSAVALPPGPVIGKDYRFKDANGTDVGLGDLFGDHTALVVYFWMYGPQRERPCPMCTNWLGAGERQCP